MLFPPILFSPALTPITRKQGLFQEPLEGVLVWVASEERLRLATGLTGRAVRLGGPVSVMQGMGQPAQQLENLMKSLAFETTLPRTSVWVRSLALVSLAAGAWAVSAGAAHARGDNDVYWSIGIHQPGVSVGVSNAPPVVYQPRPRVLVVERPVIYERPVVYQRPVVVHPRPVVVYEAAPYAYGRPVVVYGDHGYRRIDDRRGHKHKKWHKRHGGGRHDD